ncbi:oligopeptide/dipeptide ABC transporter ATP-binding protein [Halobacterium sp. KA-6]|uniref:oligopeptide/dipeptide ABC transporter ATP-binding protein n=1 Tax=Halobacterium sp. KA-6 TaxID=2896368 RepID=UPI001E315F38|nr:ABC transporter ATP-binding protein [Halobacterium sp. KA-6]MCD2204061.1 ABC transporter ATP-binding protein [Halobacterium sp. KA-6]
MTENALFEVNGLRKLYQSREDTLLASLKATLTRDHDYLKAVDGVSFDIREGELLGVAGQSGCGKSTLGELLVGLQEATSGDIRFRGEDITEYSSDEMQEFRRQCQVIFQDPYESLNPRFPVARTVAEPLVIHDIGTSGQRDERVRKALEDAGLRPAEKYLDQLPSELSGGERQRVAIARALVLNPDFIVADEPVSMLDVSVRTGILRLFKRLQRERDLTMFYVSHDLSTIRYLTDRTMIMYLGNVVELGPTEQVIENPQHPYTEVLLDSVPNPDPEAIREKADRNVEAPDPVDLPSGCRFQPYCEYATEDCAASEPELDYHVRRSADGDETQMAACYHPLEAEEVDRPRS